MGIVKAFSGAIGSTFADQWLDIITAGQFNELTLCMPGEFRETNKWRGSNTKHSDGVITNGSKIFVPENTAAFVWSQDGIEESITEPGGYTYENGEGSIFSGGKGIIRQIGERTIFGGVPNEIKRVSFVNLREIRNIKFGTKGPLVYNDKFYNADLEIYSYGTFSIQVVDPVKVVKNFIPANTHTYTFADLDTRLSMLTDFLQSFICAVGNMSSNYRISALPSQANEIANIISSDPNNAGSWEDRFGIVIRKVSIENIEFTEESRELVSSYNKNRMNVAAYEGISANAANVAAQQKIAEGIKENGLGDGGGMIMGMNLAGGINPISGNMQNDTSQKVDAFEEIRKYKVLLEENIISEDEFNAKKKELLGL